jgi:hypothetical protein
VHSVAAGVEAFIVRVDALEAPARAVTLDDLISTTSPDERSLSTPFTTELRASVCVPAVIAGNPPEQLCVPSTGASVQDAPGILLNAPSTYRLNLYARMDSPGFVV